LQEDIERRTVAIAVSASKLTGRVLAAAVRAAMRQMQQQRENAKTLHGRQSVKKLMNHGVNTNTIPLDGDTHLFDKMARKYNVDYSFRKTGPQKYMLFFKAGQADAITQCFSEYSKRAMKKEQRPSILKRMVRITEAIRRKTPRERQHTREAARGDR